MLRDCACGVWRVTARLRPAQDMRRARRTCAAIIFIAFVVAQEHAGGATEATSNTTSLLTSIRRRLMADNYDYLPSDTEAEEALSPRRDNTAEEATPLPASAVRHSGLPPPALGAQLDDILIPRVSAAAADSHSADVLDAAAAGDRSVSQLDLLDHIHDGGLQADGGAETVNYVSYESDVTEPPVGSTSRTPKYKLLKVKHPHASRRSQPRRRFLQEETSSGVAIINLDEQPFPQFRLPRARRQYMEGDLSQEVDVPTTAASPADADTAAAAAAVSTATPL